MSILTYLFGTKGTVRFQGTDINDKILEGKLGFEGIGVTNESLKELICNSAFVEAGIKLKSVKILGILETV